MNIHYVYLLKSRKDKKLYIGARTTPDGLPSADTAYKSSCKVMSKTYLSNCQKRILAAFNSRKEAIAYEVFLHKKYQVSSNDRFFNAAMQTTTSFCTQGTKLSKEHKAKINPKGRVMSESTKDKIRSKSYKSNLSDEARFNMGKRWRGKAMPNEVKNKISKAKLGCSHTDEAKANMSATRKGGDNSNSKSVLCVETGVTYTTLKEAATAVGLKGYDSIWKACVGKQKKAKGYTWKYT